MLCYAPYAKLWPSFPRLVFEETQAARNLIIGSLETLPFNSVLIRLVRLSTYFLWYSCKFEHYFSNCCLLLMFESSVSVFSAVFLNLSSLLKDREVGRNEIVKKGPSTDLCSKRSPVQLPIPFSRLMPSGPGIQAIPF